ncbi:MAG: serine dehydratase subunit alpha family protein, partial [Spirochaetales bacterium]|nr:serine dehydratase subunit alpha family protein [Spirochaetales bacterium]MDY4067348.1 serine dehydratase subunit alpha family protein [Bullifex sp.]
MNTIFDAYTKILDEELKPALGCTEPVAIAYASAAAAELINRNFDKLIVECSGNVVKNVKSVTVPNSNGMKGIEAAALLGALGGTSNLH